MTIQIKRQDKQYSHKNNRKKHAINFTVYIKILTQIRDNQHFLVKNRKGANFCL